MYTLLLTIHIIGGFTALGAGLAACLIKQFARPHHWHVVAGRAFMVGYLVIFSTALMMVWLKINYFLLFIALFSFYLALTGWRYARRAAGFNGWDKLLHGAFAVIAVAMIGYAWYGWQYGQPPGLSTPAVVSGVFGSFMLFFAGREWCVLRTSTQPAPKPRIARHLTFMLAANIGTVTAFVVTNLTLQPAFILWLAPTLILTPYIVYWNHKVLE